MSENTPPPPPSEENPDALRPAASDEGSSPAVEVPEPVDSEEAVLGSGRRKPPFWRRFGGEGFMVSVVIHAILVLIAAFLIISVTKESSQKDPNAFATGAGGGAAGDKAKSYETKVKPKNVKALAKNASRITSKSTTATIALPELPASTNSSMLSGMMSGGSSKGFGGGTGGGIGSGIGVGVGNGKNFVGRPIMGTKVFAQRIAVYMDASGSLLAYLEKVEAQIKKQFPDADVFMYNGIYTYVQDGVVMGGKRFKGQPVVSVPGAASRSDGTMWATDQKKLTSTGKAIFKKYDDNFKQGSVGAWLDIMREEKGYDALIVFSDFNDGVRQYRLKGEPKDRDTQRVNPLTVYYDGTSGGVGVGKDFRKPEEKQWEAEWLKTFAGGPTGNAPRLYLFSTVTTPQPLVAECAKVSGGSVMMVKWLATGGQPPEDPVDPATAGSEAIPQTPVMREKRPAR